MDIHKSVLFEKWRKIKLQETAAGATDAYTAEDLIKELLDPGFPTLYKEISTAYEVEEGESSKIVFVPEKKGSPGTLTAGDFGADFVAMTPSTISLSSERGHNFQWNRAYFEMAPWDVVSVHAKEGLRSLAEYIFAQELATILATTSNTFDTAGATLAFADLVTGIKTVAVDNYTVDFIVISPKQWAELMADDKVINTLYQDAKPVQTGIVGQLLGADVIVTTKMTDDKVIFGSRKGLATASARLPRIEEYSYPDVNKYGLVCSMWMGYKLVLPNAFAVATVV